MSSKIPLLAAGNWTFVLVIPQERPRWGEHSKCRKKLIFIALDKLKEQAGCAGTSESSKLVSQIHTNRGPISSSFGLGGRAVVGMRTIFDYLKSLLGKFGQNHRIYIDEKWNTKEKVLCCESFFGVWPFCQTSGLSLILCLYVCYARIGGVDSFVLIAPYWCFILLEPFLSISKF